MTTATLQSPPARKDPPSLRRNLRAVYADAIAFSVMTGTGEAYLAAFVLAVGLGEVNSGLITAAPLLIGAILQMVSPLAVTWLGSHKRWVICCVVAQAASFAPLIIAAVTGWAPASLVYLAAAVYWGAGMATGPAWNTWVGTLVPPSMRVGFFARRSRAAQVALLCAWMLGGFILETGKRWHDTTDARLDEQMLAFAMLFSIAAAARIYSSTLLASQTEPVPLPPGQRRVGARELLGRIVGGDAKSGGDLQLLLYMACVTLMVQISGPYFTPYMLGKLKMSYWQYSTLVAVALLAKILVLPAWARLVQRTGETRLLWICGIGLVPLSGLWLISDHFAWLLCVQITAGTMWAGFELATFLLLFETISAAERTSVLTTYNLLNAMATLAGALIGGSILHAFDESRQGYLVVFAASGGARLLTLALLARVTKMRVSLHPVHLVRPISLALRMIAVRPQLGSLDRPVIPAMEEESTDPNQPRTAGK